MHEYHFYKLTKPEQRYYHKLIDVFKHGKTEVWALPIMGKESVIRAITSVSFDHPEFFYVNFKNLKLVRTFSGITYHVEYLFKASFWERLSRETDEKIEKIVKDIRAAKLKNDFERVIWLHNYFVRNMRYNYDALSNPDVYPEAFNVRGVVTEGRAVCEGISKAFKLLCDRLGIESIVVSGKSTLEGFGDGIEHAWNIIKINNNYVHMDITWDIGLSEVSNFTRFDYFCLSDEELKIDHDYENEIYPTCQTDEYSYFSRRRRVFKNVQSLQQYVEKELRERNSVIYFKIDNRNS